MPLHQRPFPIWEAGKKCLREKKAVKCDELKIEYQRYFIGIL